MISKTFEALRSEGRAALIPYVTAGYPTREATVPLLERLAGSGADIVELGIPFSDPLADGPTIQRSSFTSLENGTTVASVLADLRTFRSTSDIDVVLMTYLNPVLAYGTDTNLEKFTRWVGEFSLRAKLFRELPEMLLDRSRSIGGICNEVMETYVRRQPRTTAA